MYNATAYHHSYEDSGLLCIHASADPRQVGTAAWGQSHDAILNLFKNKVDLSKRKTLLAVEMDLYVTYPLNSKSCVHFCYIDL